MVKTCSKCGLQKYPTEYYRCRCRRDGLNSVCKSCYKKYIPKNSKINQRNWYNSLSKKRKEQIKERIERWRQNNKERVRVICRRAQLNWIKKPGNIISARVRTAVWKSLSGRKQIGGWLELLGYTMDELRAHLESKFDDWMTFENYGKWEVDHIRPISSFKFDSIEDEDFKKCWALENLQPLEKYENRKKYNKY